METAPPPSNSSAVSKGRKNKQDIMKYIKNERDMKNYESYQQAVLLVLLNHYCSFSIQKPLKTTSSIEPRPEVIELVFDTDSINVQTLTENNCKSILSFDLQQDIKKKTALRRFSKNKTIFTVNLLFDILLEKGFFFNSKKSKKSAKSIQAERIEDIFYLDNLLMSRETIVEKGRKLNDYFYTMVKSKKSVTIVRDDKTIYDMLFSC